MQAQIKELEDDTPAGSAGGETPAPSGLAAQQQHPLAQPPLGTRSLPAAAAAAAAAAAGGLPSSLTCQSSGFPARKLVSRKSSLPTGVSDPRGELKTPLSTKLAAAAGDGTPWSCFADGTGLRAGKVGGTTAAGAGAAAIGGLGKLNMQGMLHRSSHEGDPAYEQQQQRVKQQDRSDDLQGFEVECDEDVLLSDGEEGADGVVLDSKDLGEWFRGAQAGLRDITNFPGVSSGPAGLKSHGAGIGLEGEEQHGGQELEEDFQQQQQDEEVEEEEEGLAGVRDAGEDAGNHSDGLWDEDVLVDGMQQLDEAEWGEGANQQAEQHVTAQELPVTRAEHQEQQPKQQRSWQSGLDAVLQTTFARKPPVAGAGGSRLQRNSNSYASKMLKEHKEQEQRLQQLEQAARAAAAVPRAVFPQQLQQRPLQSKSLRLQQQKPLGRSPLVNVCEEDVISDSQGDSDIMEITPLPGPAAAARAGRLGSASQQQQQQQLLQQQQHLGQRRVSGQSAASAGRPGLTPEGSAGHQTQLSLRASLLQTPGPTAALNFSRMDHEQQQQQLRASTVGVGSGSMCGFGSDRGWEIGGNGAGVGEQVRSVPAAAAGADHKPPWWDVLPDFVPVEVLAERGLDPR